MILSLFLSCVFFLISSIHFYWSLGGKFGFYAALPSNEKGEIILHPKKIDCIIVGVVFLLFCLFYLKKSTLLSIYTPPWVLNYGGWIIPSIFILRAIGDFKYLGFFKRIRTTKFGKADTYYFAPLCLIIAISGFLLELYS